MTNNVRSKASKSYSQNDEESVLIALNDRLCDFEVKDSHLNFLI